MHAQDGDAKASPNNAAREYAGCLATSNACRSRVRETTFCFTHSPRAQGPHSTTNSPYRMLLQCSIAAIAVASRSCSGLLMSDDGPQWDKHFADQLHGAVVLVGITHNEPDGPRLEQFFGTVIATDEREGVTIQLAGSRSGDTYRLPPDLRAFFRARPGSYRLHDTGEVIIDPDFTTTWELTPPKN